MRKKSIIQLIFFLIVLIIIGLLLDFIIEKGVKRSEISWTGKVNKICSQINEPQIAIFGSSVGEVGISPIILSQQLKKSAYNFSIDGTPFIQYEGLIKEFLNKNEKTEIVVLAEAYFSLSSKNEITEIQRYLANINNDNVYNSLFFIQPDLAWKCRHLPLYKYITTDHTYFMNAFDGYKRYFSGNELIDSNFGQRPVDRNWEVDEDLKIKESKYFDIIIDSHIVNKYDFILKKTKNKNKKTFIVLMPVFKLVSKKYTNLEPVRKELYNLAKNNNVTFLDFTTLELCNQKEYFYNSNHLNRKGSSIISNILADSICGIK